MAKEISSVLSTTSNAVGRPRSVNEGEMYDLMSYLKKGYTVSLSCVKAGVSRSAFYAEMKRNEEFQDKITAVRDEMTSRATGIIYNSLRRGNEDTARWWLDRQDRRERNAQRAKEFRLIKKMTITKSKTYQETEAVELELDTRTN